LKLKNLKRRRRRILNKRLLSITKPKPLERRNNRLNSSASRKRRREKCRDSEISKKRLKTDRLRLII
jgi:hypothetical protein